MEKNVAINSTTQAINEGIAYLPRNRKENAIIKDMNIIENASIVTWSTFFKARNDQCEKASAGL